ncbi:HNH endonuclease signature motif containing protein [Desertimonas flava]|uniref:HNH endonuclease signature motif containing protein n=1 Tax=Desertimonas flava TaxID=2064846 RepID=UPI0023F18F8B|nr:HNH endonuclease signature motif containing protein [Desertimonas flava]
MCDVDHIVPVHASGDNSQDNGRLMCRFHNRITPTYCTPPPADPAHDTRTHTPNLLPNPPPRR